MAGRGLWRADWRSAGQAGRESRSLLVQVCERAFSVAHGSSFVVKSSCWLCCTIAMFMMSWGEKGPRSPLGKYHDMAKLWHKGHEDKVGHFRVHFRYLELWYRDAGIQPALVQSCPTRRPGIEIPLEVSTESTVDLFSRGWLRREGCELWPRLSMSILKFSFLVAAATAPFGGVGVFQLRMTIPLASPPCFSSIAADW